MIPSISVLSEFFHVSSAGPHLSTRTPLLQKNKNILYGLISPQIVACLCSAM